MWKKLILPLLVLGLGIAGAMVMVQAKPEVDTVEPEVSLPLVRVQPVHEQSIRLEVHSQGSVLPRTAADLVAEVDGRIVEVAADFESGGFFREGEVLLRLDDRDYELARASAAAQVAQARTRLAREEAEAEVALEEWQELGEGQATALVLREPQLQEARANVAAAEATLARAELDLERTRIRAPFAGRVRQKHADVGQFVNRGTPLGAIHSVDTAEVRLPVPTNQLRYLELPVAYQDSRDLGKGPRVTLEADFAGRRHSWVGRVVRSEGEVDLETRMVHLVARVEKPYERSTSAPNRPPLSVGLFVEARIAGRQVDSLIEVPRSALRGDHTVLVLDGDRLRLRDVEIFRRRPSSVLVSGGLTSGESVCVSPLDAVVDGMRVRAQSMGTQDVEADS